MMDMDTVMISFIRLPLFMITMMIVAKTTDMMDIHVVGIEKMRLRVGARNDAVFYVIPCLARSR